MRCLAKLRVGGRAGGRGGVHGLHAQAAWAARAVVCAGSVGCQAQTGLGALLHRGGRHERPVRLMMLARASSNSCTAAGNRLRCTSEKILMTEFNSLSETKCTTKDPASKLSRLPSRIYPDTCCIPTNPRCIVHRSREACAKRATTRPTMSDQACNTRRRLLEASLEARAQALRLKVEALAAADPAEASDVGGHVPTVVKHLSEGQQRVFALERELHQAKERIRLLSEENGTLRHRLLKPHEAQPSTEQHPSLAMSTEPSAMSAPQLPPAAPSLDNQQATVSVPRRALKRRASIDAAEVMLGLRESVRRNVDRPSPRCPPGDGQPFDASTTIVKSLASMRGDRLWTASSTSSASLPVNSSCTSLCSLGGLSDRTCDVARSDEVSENTWSPVSVHGMAS